MEKDTQERLRTAWLRLPDEVRSPVATQEQLKSFEGRWGHIPEDCRWFLETLGGGPVGSEWIDDIAALGKSHAKWRQEFGPPAGWSLPMFVIGWDGGGNPIGIADSGEVVAEYHDGGGVAALASSFAAFLEWGLLERQ